MGNSNIRNSLSAAIIAITILSVTACKRSDEQVDLARFMENMEATVFDSTSAYYGNFEAYPTDISKLPIGVFDLNGNLDEYLKFLRQNDIFDNINGSTTPDQIPDLAGEKFVIFSYQPDSTVSFDLASMHTLFLTGNDYFQDAQRTKLILANGNLEENDILLKIKKFLALTGTGVKIISSSETTAETIIDLLYRTDDENDFAVGIMAQSGTIAAKEYERALSRMEDERGLIYRIPSFHVSISNDETGYSMMDAAFISLIESLHASGTKCVMRAVVTDFAVDEAIIDTFRKIIDNYRSLRVGVEFPYRELLDPDMQFINPAQTAVTACYKQLRADKNLALNITKQEFDSFTYIPR
ncbi:MAG: hypothetical protein HUJ90_01640 [Bacteroidales bacterium]|nr:hypothetical protein [Bacteroidales bacterium]